MIGTCCLRLFPAALACVAAFGQTDKPVFEVASVKPPTALGPMGGQSNRKGGPGSGDPTSYLCENCPISWVFSEAFDVQPWEWVAPDWIISVRYDFAAKIPPGTSKADFHSMLQNLLAERFGLVVHREQKEMMLYELTVGKGGPKFKEGVPRDAPPAEGPGRLKRDEQGFPVLPYGTSMAISGNHAAIRADNRPMSWLAQMLSGQLGGPVVDATGLGKTYDYQVLWTWDQADMAAAQDGARSSLIGAVQSQLGLRLEHKKGRVSVLVVDHMNQKATGN